MHSDARQDLENVLEREIEVASELAAALEAERDALTGSSPELVQRRAAQKAALVAEMERLEIERRRLTAQTGAALPPAGGRAPQPGDGHLGARWAVLADILRRCRTVNEVNGFIINVRRSQVGQLLNVLRGGGSQTYGPQGKPSAGTLRELARA